MLNGRSGSAERGSQALIRERPSSSSFCLFFAPFWIFLLLFHERFLFWNVCRWERWVLCWHQCDLWWLKRFGFVSCSSDQASTSPGELFPPWMFKYSYWKFFWIGLPLKCVSSCVILVHGLTRKKLQCVVFEFLKINKIGENSNLF